MNEPDERLRELLNDTPPPTIEALPEDVRADLADVIAGARRKQAADLATAFEATLKHIPFPLRGIVKKVLLG